MSYKSARGSISPMGGVSVQNKQLMGELKERSQIESRKMKDKKANGGKGNLRNLVFLMH